MKKKNSTSSFFILHCVEDEAEQVGLHYNAKKTELQIFNHETLVTIKVKNGDTLKIVENFKYLGAWTESSRILP